MALYWIDCTHCLLIWLEICICSCGSFVPSPPQSAQQVAQPALLLWRFHSCFFSHNSGSDKFSFTNGKKRSPLFLWNQVLLLVSSCAEPMKVMLNFPSKIWRLGERMSGLVLHSPGHLSPSSVPYLDPFSWVITTLTLPLQHGESTGHNEIQWHMMRDTQNNFLAITCL